MVNVAFFNYCVFFLLLLILPNSMAARFAEWNSTELAHGFTLHTRSYSELYAGAQTLSVLELLPSVSSVEPVATNPATCETVAVQGERLQGIAAINAGFFSMSECYSLSLVKQDREVVATNPPCRNARASLGWRRTKANAFVFDLIASNDEFAEADSALGGGPQLVKGGIVNVTADYEGFCDIASTNPRTFFAKTVDGSLLFGTVDGRTGPRGMTLGELAEFLVNELDCTDAVNMDGGGSTTLWTRDLGVVNYPSNNGLYDHAGSRPVVSSLLFRLRANDTRAAVKRPPRSSPKKQIAERCGTSSKTESSYLNCNGDSTESQP